MPDEPSPADRLPRLPLNEPSRGGGGPLVPLLRARKLDVALAVATVLWLAPTITYRYGIDQALYHYVGAGWLEGRLPYRDAFDVKPPGIYALYALVIAVLGKAESSIRVAEIACVVATGFLAGRAVRGEVKPIDGVAGATALLTGAFYSSRFGFWDSAQVELWEGAFAVAAYAVLPRNGSRMATFASGVLASIAILFKVTACLPAAALFGFVVIRALRGDPESRSKRACASGVVFATGLAAPLAATALYFAAHGAFRFLVEWARYAEHYARAPLDEAWVRGIGPESLVAPSGLFYGVFLSLWLLGWTEATRRGDRESQRTSVETLILLVLAVLSVAIQRRYLSYHAAVFTPFLALAAVGGVARGMEVRRGLTTGAIFLLSLGGFLNSWPWLDGRGMTYGTYVLHVFFPRLGGRLSSEQAMAAFVGPFGYSYEDHREIAALIHGRTPRKGDRLHVRGFDPTVYVLTGLYSPSRFMMEVPLTSDYLAAFDPSFRIEHARSLSAHPPRFVVTHTREHEDVAAFLAKGYGRVGARGALVLLERGYGERRLDGDELRQRIPGGTARGTAMGAIPFTIRFREDGSLTAAAGDGTDEGTYNVRHDGFVCLRFARYLDGRTSCVELVERAGKLTAYDAENRDVAVLVFTAK